MIRPPFDLCRLCYYEPFVKVTATSSKGAAEGHKGAALERVCDGGGACVEAQLRAAAA